VCCVWVCVCGWVGGGHEGSGSGGAADLEPQECPAGWKKPSRAVREERRGEAQKGEREGGDGRRTSGDA